MRLRRTLVRYAADEGRTGQEGGVSLKLGACGEASESISEFRRRCHDWHVSRVLLAR
jgi:hypothetical protein